LIYDTAGDSDRALSHFRNAIRYGEDAGDFYGAALTRYNVALALARSGHFADARAYAVAARDGYASYGDRAATEVQRVDRLISQIEQDIARRTP
jgi:hypothetical protein